MQIPLGYEQVARGASKAFCLPELRVWVEHALSLGTLHSAASLESLQEMEGRSSVHVIEVEGVRRAVRHYLRGGAMAGLFHDRYPRVGPSRPVRELRASLEARRRGIQTPRVAAGAVYHSGPFYRADLVTDYVSDSRTLAQALFGSETLPAHQRLASVAAALTLVDDMASAGFQHADANAHNVLLTAESDGVKAAIIDLDRATFSVAATPVSGASMRQRLKRSLEKIADHTGLPLTDEEWRHFARADSGAASV